MLGTRKVLFRESLKFPTRYGTFILPDAIKYSNDSPYPVTLGDHSNVVGYVHGLEQSSSGHVSGKIVFYDGGTRDLEYYDANILVDDITEMPNPANDTMISHANLRGVLLVSNLSKTVIL